MNTIDHYEKYVKYKTKYMLLKNVSGGGINVVPLKLLSIARIADSIIKKKKCDANITYEVCYATELNEIFPTDFRIIVLQLMYLQKRLEDWVLSRIELERMNEYAKRDFLEENKITLPLTAENCIKYAHGVEKDGTYNTYFINNMVHNIIEICVNSNYIDLFIELYGNKMDLLNKFRYIVKRHLETAVCKGFEKFVDFFLFKLPPVLHIGKVGYGDDDYFDDLLKCSVDKIYEKKEYFMITKLLIESKLLPIRLYDDLKNDSDVQEYLLLNVVHARYPELTLHDVDYFINLFKEKKEPIKRVLDNYIEWSIEKREIEAKSGTFNKKEQQRRRDAHPSGDMREDIREHLRQILGSSSTK